MAEVVEQPIRLRIAFTLLALFLVVVAGTRWGLGAFLFPAFFLAVVGLIVLLASRSPAPTRWAAFGVFAYVFAWVLAWFASTPITLGEQGYWVNGYPSEWALIAQEALITALPTVTLVGVGVALWPWSSYQGRGFLIAAGGLLVLNLAFGVFSEPPTWDGAGEGGGQVDTTAVARANLFATLSTLSFSLACLAEVVALGLLVARPPAVAASGEPVAR